MRNLFLKITIFTLLIGLIGCSKQSFEGKYTYQGDKTGYLEFKADGKVLLHDNKDVTGTYELKEDCVAITVVDIRTSTVVLKREDDTLVSADGKRFVKNTN